MKNYLRYLFLCGAIVVICLSSSCSKDSGVDVSKPFSYEETAQIPVGLISAPDGGHSESWTYELCTEYIGEEQTCRINALFPNLTSWSFTPNSYISFFPDNTVFCGAEMKFIGDDANDHITISFNSDHPVTLSAYALEIGNCNNQFENTSLWCGHSIRYWGRYDDPDVETDDCYYAAFQIEGTNFIIASEGLPEETFSNAVKNIIKIFADNGK